MDTAEAEVVSGDFVTEVRLPSGGKATFRDPTELRAKDKRRVIDNVTHDTGLASGLDVMEGCIALLVVKWEIPYLPNAPLPSAMWSILGELTIPDYDTLVEAAGVAESVLFPQSTPDDAGKPGTPTLPASA